MAEQCCSMNKVVHYCFNNVVQHWWSNNDCWNKLVRYCYHRCLTLLTVSVMVEKCCNNIVVMAEQPCWPLMKVKVMCRKFECRKDIYYKTQNGTSCQWRHYVSVGPGARKSLGPQKVMTCIRGAGWFSTKNIFEFKVSEISCILRAFE